MAITRSSLVIATAALVLGTTGGAVAGGAITGAQIENGTVTGKDVKDKSLKTGDLSAKTVAALHGATGPKGDAGQPGAPGAPGAPGGPGMSEFEFIFDTMPVAGGTPADMGLECPTGKTMIDVTGFWNVSSAAVQAVPADTVPSGGVVFTEGVPEDDDLFITITCAVVETAAPRPAATPLKGS